MIERDLKGLIKNVEYKFTEEGLVDWKKMIPVEFLVPNEQKLDEDQKSLLKDNQLDVQSLQDNQVLILLGGIKKLAFLRGYSKVSFEIRNPSRDYCCSVCNITWIPNFETEGREIVFSSVADAHAGSTDNMAVNYLASIAENRSFVRCVRNFLRINILGKEEIKLSAQADRNEAPDKPAMPEPKKILISLMEEKNVSFDQIKKKLVSLGLLEAQDYETIKDIPAGKTLELISMLQKAKVKA